MVAGLAVAVLLLSSGGALQALPSDQCHEVDIPPLFLARGGVWADDELLVLDILKQRLLRFDPATREGGFLRDGAWQHPSSLKRRNGEILMLDEGTLGRGMPGPRSSIVRFDERMHPRDEKLPVKGRSLGTLQQSLGSRPVLEAIYDWQPMDEGIVAFGDVKIAGGAGWESAFLFLDEQGRQEVFYRLSPNAQVCNHYTLTFDYIAALRDRAYILFLDPVPKIGEVIPGRSGVRELPAFPEDFRNRPVLETRQGLASTGQGARQATLFYEILEGSRMAAGLYARGEHLYLLGKEAIDAEGDTTWWLIQLDPTDGSELSRLRLPTEAAHLTVVPGSDFWALIEKGPVQGIGERHAPYMDTSSMVLVPTDWIEDPDSRPEKEEAMTACAPVGSNFGAEQPGE